MSFDGSEFLALAQELAGKKKNISTEEAQLRSAISRAYYAAFLESRKFLRNRRGQRVSFSGQAHEEVKEVFLHDPDEHYQNVGANLETLHILRKQADYGDRFTSTLSTLTDMALLLAQNIISTVKPPRS
jgi:uncharacterized protein (UPF0332 family)